LQYHLIDVFDKELRLMGDLQWLISNLKEEQQALNQRQKDDKWLEFLKHELNQQRQTLQSTPLKPLLNKLCYDRDGHEINNWQLPVILTPLMLAHCCLTSIPVTWQDHNAILFKLRRLKTFDESWFNTAFTWTLAYLSQQPNYSQTLQQEIASMINFDENDLIPKIEQELATDVRSFKDIQE